MNARLLTGLAVLTALAAALGAAAWTGALPGDRFLRSIVWSADELAAWDRARHAEVRVATFRAEAAPRDAVVFLGSALVERYPLAQSFPGKPVVDRGVAGDTVRDVLERLDVTLVGLAPAAFVLHVGADDLRREGAVTGPVRDRLLELIDALNERHPDVPVTVLGLVARPDADEAELYETRLYNTAAQRAAVTRKAAFVVLDREPLTDDAGRLDPRFASDAGGLNADGYREVSTWLVKSGGIAGQLLAP